MALTPMMKLKVKDQRKSGKRRPRPRPNAEKGNGHEGAVLKLTTHSNRPFDMLNSSPKKTHIMQREHPQKASYEQHLAQSTNQTTRQCTSNEDEPRRRGNARQPNTAKPTQLTD